MLVAAEQNQVEVVKALLARHADPEAKDAFGETALTRAEAAHHTELARLLRATAH